MIVLYIALGIIAVIVIWFIQPYSPLKQDFNKQATDFIAESIPTDSIITDEQIKNLPVTVQRYFNYCGYIGSQKTSYMKLFFKNATFVLGINQPTLKIDYTQYNFVNGAKRMAFIDSFMFGIPFQGFDSFVDGVGSMKGVIAKVIPLFNQTGEEINKASLVTFLSESLLFPNAVLQDFIAWEDIDDTHAKAIITYNGISASGIFTFNESGEWLSFTTDDRTAIDFNGNKQNIEWSAILSDYRENDGIKRPTRFKAVWHYPEGDLVYFDGQITSIEQ